MMSGGAGGPARALDRRAGSELTAAWPTSDPLAGRARLGADRYSRRVALLKRLLPAVGLTLLLLDAVRPRLAPPLHTLPLAFPPLTLPETPTLKTTNPTTPPLFRPHRPP